MHRKDPIYYADTANQEQEHGADPLQCQTTQKHAPGTKLLGDESRELLLLLGINYFGRLMRSTLTPLQATVVHHDWTPERRGGGRTPL